MSAPAEVSILRFKDLSPTSDALSTADDAWLTRLALDCQPEDYVVPFAARHPGDEPGPLLERTTAGWSAGRYIGELRRGDRILRIEPRLGIETIGSWLRAITGVVAVPHAAAQGDSADLLIAPIVGQLWVSAVRQAARHGLPTLRTTRINTGTVVRGRLNGRATANLAARGVAQVGWTERPRSLNNPVGRTIIAADNVLGGLLDSHDPNWRGPRASEVVGHIRREVGNRPKLPLLSELNSVRYSPIRLPYRKLATLSWSIARYRGIQNTPAGSDIDGILLDVAEVWELFVLHCCKRAFTAHSVRHGTTGDGRRYLLTAESDSRHGLGRLLPDIIIGDGPDLLIDAKYKRLSESHWLQREDLYQLAAYVSQATTADAVRTWDRGVSPSAQLPTGMLAYPADPGGSAKSREESLGPWLSSQGNRMVFVRLPVSESACVESLRHAASATETRAEDEPSWT